MERSEFILTAWAQSTAPGSSSSDTQCRFADFAGRFGFVCDPGYQAGAEPPEPRFLQVAGDAA